MKSKILLMGMAMLALFMFACGGGQDSNVGVAAADTPREPIDITFQIANAPDSLVKIVGTIGSTNYLVDSMVMKGGMVHLKRDTALPGGLYFLLVGRDIVFQFLIDQDQTFTLTGDVRDVAGGSKVVGSLDNELLYQNLVWEKGFQARFQPIQTQYGAMKEDDPQKRAFADQLDLLVKERKAHLQTYKDKHPDAFFTLYKLAGQNPELHEIHKADGSYDEEKRIFLYRNEFWDNTPLDDERLLRTPIIYNKLGTYMTQITPQIHDSLVKYADMLIEKSRVNKEVFKFIVNWIAIEYHKPKTMGMESVFVHLVDKYFTDKDAFWSTPEDLKEIRREVNEMRPSLVGTTGQDITCTSMQGQQESFYDMKCKVPILFIFNYECEHCQEQAPQLRKIYDQYHSRGLDVYALCTGVDDKEWRKFIAKYNTGVFHNVMDPAYKSEFYKKYHVDITPEIYVMDANHKIVCKDLHPEQLPIELEKLLK